MAEEGHLTAGDRPVAAFEIPYDERSETRAATVIAFAFWIGFQMGAS